MLTIQALAGHQSLETTQRYMHLARSAPAEGMRALERYTGSAPEAALEAKSSEVR